MDSVVARDCVGVASTCITVCAGAAICAVVGAASSGSEIGACGPGAIDQFLRLVEELRGIDVL
jgi:hypothetical protein